jgi:Vacuolar sorting protein 9 (VPS9) domain
MTATGADDFTPVLIYTVIKAQPDKLASNLAFIERYRMRSKLTSESQYYFIGLVSAHTCFACFARLRVTVLLHWPGQCTHMLCML